VIRPLILRLALAVHATLLLATAVAAPHEPQVYAFVDVTVIPMDADRVFAGQTVIVRDGRIEAIGAAAKLAVPDEAARIEGKGRYLMPGVAEMHAHIPPQPGSEQDTLDTLFLYVANGITFARGMLGAPHHLELRGQAARGEIVSPRIYTSGPSLNGNSVATPAAGRAMVAEQKSAGYDFLKIHPGLDRARYDAIVAAAKEHDIAWAGHVSHAVGLPHALDTGQATVDHLDAFIPPLLRDGSPKARLEPSFFGWNLADEVDEAKIAPLARRIRAAGTWIVPTESLMQHVLLPYPTAEELARREEMRFVSRGLRAQWVERKEGMLADPAYKPELARQFIEVRGKLIKTLHEEGAGLLLGSDAPQIFNVPGFSIHHELRMLVKAGLTPYQALATGNVNVAKFLGEEDEFGTVAVGQRADLVLLEANPLEDIRNFSQRAGVMLGGRWLPAAVLRAGLEEIAQRHRSEQLTLRSH
jgi:imidazolonepropionase-like amidohydrolase